MALLLAYNISKQENNVFTVKNISFTQQSSQRIAIAGETGSGKTTLLKLIAGLLQPDEGEILFEGKRILGPLEKLIPGHRHIAYLSQHFELRNNYRVEEELESKNLLPEEEAQRIYSICRIDHLLQRKTEQLSGGERQRIVLARLLTTSPRLLLLDEPFSNLDAMHKSVISSVLDDISSQLGLTCILVSHDAADTLSWADNIIVLQAGQMIQQGSPETIYRYPVNEYCAGLFGEYNLIKQDGRELFVRPEQLRLATEGEVGIAGTVKDIRYWGSYYTAGIECDGQVLKMRMDRKLFSVGDKVSLSFSKEESYLPQRH